MKIEIKRSIAALAVALAAVAVGMNVLAGSAAARSAMATPNADTNGTTIVYR